MSAGERSVLDLLADLKAGSVTGKTLEAGDRRRIVEHLTAEGYSTPEIAKPLGVSERTVGRDRKAVRQGNALRADPRFVEETVGQLVATAEGAVARLRRLGRDRETPAGVRVEAEKGVWQVARELTGTLQRLGYLPTAPTQLQAQVLAHHTHELQAPEDYRRLQEEIDRVQAIAQGAAPEALAELDDVRDEVQRGLLHSRLRLIESSCREAEPPEVDPELFKGEGCG